MGWTIGVDVGGTFTDFYAASDEGQVHVGKTASTPSNPAQAILEGLSSLCQRHGIPAQEIKRLSHGTTVGTNALIQRKGSRVALVTTRGFRDLLEIGRQTRPHMYDLQKDHPAPLVDREYRFEINERVDARGEVVRAPSAHDVAQVVQAVVESGASACAVGLLFAFRNPDHEQQIARALREQAPHIAVSLSSEVQPEFREYERLSTTVLNAYLQPLMSSYLQTLMDGAELFMSDAVIGINQSSGGLMSPQRARQFPVRTALSGPAAGVVGAAHTARQTDKSDVITLDVGGTSADVALIRDYEVELAFDRDVAGFPIRMPCVDVETVGAGGGSVAWFDKDGLLKVGPLSAGADPGPACYGRGGEQATVTDANLLLGRLSTRGLLDGDMVLDAELARSAFAPIAKQLGFSLERTAHGALGIVVANMVRTIRTISVERGYDPRDCILMPFGGAGPLHARDVAMNLGITQMIVPAAPGIVCAQGLLVSDLKEDFVASRLFPLDDTGRVNLATTMIELRRRAQQWFELEDVPKSGRVLELKVDARYVGQNFELSVPLIAGATLNEDDIPTVAQLHSAFCQAHETAYGYASADHPIEIVNVRLSAKGVLTTDASAAVAASAPPHPVAREARPVFFGAEAAELTQVYDRADLLPGQVVAGPAIIEQLDATTLVYPGDRAEVTAHGHLRISMEAGSRD